MPTTKELLDPESWGEVLGLYARSVDVAVALIDHDGRLIGKCHNPNPIWSLAQAARPEWGLGCIFCLDSDRNCSAAADAAGSRSLVLVSGVGGFAHVAIPLFLGERHLGTLLAGQVFDQYPDLLLMEKVAKDFGLSGQELWRLARLRIPVSRATLTTYGNLLGTLGHAFLRERYSNILQRHLAEANTKLASSNQHLKESNSKLSGKVAALDQSLAEKDILLNEVHHRVNNNLQVIASLLRMQAEDFPDDQVADALQQTQLRVESMALIHEQLYDSHDWGSVNFAEYTRVLVNNLFHSHGVDQSRITCKVEMGALELSVDKAIPAGMILNELISNTLKHAFPGGRQGSIQIRGCLHGEQIELRVEDDGVGIVEKPVGESRRRPPLGLRIVTILCHQLKGAFTEPPRAKEEIGGSVFHISFPFKTPPRRRR